MAFEAAAFTFGLRPADTSRLPSYLGSALRGSFGRSFRRAVCALRGKDCATCPLRKTCPYVQVFETPVPQKARMLSGTATAPHPFVFTPPPPGGVTDQLIHVRVVLLGRAIGLFPSFVWAYTVMGRQGLGGSRVPFELSWVRLGNPPRGQSLLAAGGRVLKTGSLRAIRVGGDEPAPAPARHITLRFFTPLRLRHERRLCHKLDFALLITNVLRRLALLDQCHGDGTWQFDHRTLIEKARAVRTTHDTLRWYDWTRYSSRQKTTMQMGGLVGTIEFQGDLEPFLPYLQAAEMVNVGKNTSFGLGRMQIVSVA